MDPLTQGLLGAAAAQACFKRALPRSAGLIGFVSGVTADMDVLFPFGGDRLRQLVYHRHFTHALIFIPIGAAVAALPFMLGRGWRLRWRSVYGAALVAYATHGLLDACTAYGTVLLWPFSLHRVAWDLIAIVDPIFTLALLIGVAWSAVTRMPRPARIALVIAALYMGLGLVQHERAERAQRQVAAERGHAITRSRVMPTLGNVVVWRSLYESEGRLWADAIRANPIGPASVRSGDSLPLLEAEQGLALLAAGGDAEEDLALFQWFSDGYTAMVHDHAGQPIIGDMRYSARTAGFAPLWGLRLAPEGVAVTGLHYPGQDRRSALRGLWREIIGADP